MTAKIAKITSAYYVPGTVIGTAAYKLIEFSKESNSIEILPPFYTLENQSLEWLNN